MKLKVFCQETVAKLTKICLDMEKAVLKSV